MVKYAFIRDHRREFSVGLMCKVLRVSRSYFYAWLKAGGRSQSVKRLELKRLVSEVFFEFKQRYGSPRVFRELKARGVSVCKATVEELMRELGLRARKRKKFKKTTVPDSAHQKAPNILDRHFDPSSLNVAWVSDITYLPMRGTSKFLYLCVIIDLCSKEVVGWSVGASMETDLVIRALERAVGARGFIPQGCIFHSDQGSQYTSKAFTRLLAQYGFKQSMSRKGECWDNAPAESFFDTLKTEYVEYSWFVSVDDARDGLFEFIELFYNRKRMHSSIGFMSPTCYTRQLETEGA